MQYLFALYSFHNSFHLVPSQTAKREFKFSLYFIVRDQFARNWTMRERQSKCVAVSRVRVYGRKNIFGFYRDRTLRSLGSPPRARISVKRRPKEPTFKIPRRCLLSPRCASPSFFLPARSPFLLCSSFSSLFRLSLSLPELSTREDGGKRIIPVLSLSLPFCLLRSSRSTSEPTIRSLASLVLSRDNGSSLFVGSAH